MRAPALADPARRGLAALAAIAVLALIGFAAVQVVARGVSSSHTSTETATTASSAQLRRRSSHTRPSTIATDITPRRHAEELSAAQAERAQSASRLITMGEMASSEAHELNQPLTAINNYCNGLVSRIKGKQINEEDLLAALDKTARQAQRAGQIIQRIRSFVKRSEPNRALSDVTLMVNEAVELAEIELRRRNVRLSHYIAARLPAPGREPTTSIGVRQPYSYPIGIITPLENVAANR